jgi:hypothetical protein
MAEKIDEKELVYNLSWIIQFLLSVIRVRVIMQTILTKRRSRPKSS